MRVSDSVSFKLISVKTDNLAKMGNYCIVLEELPSSKT